MSDHADTIRAGILARDGEAGGEVVTDALAALGELVVENQRLREALTEIASETIRASADPLAIKTMSRMHHAARAALDGTP